MNITLLAAIGNRAPLIGRPPQAIFDPHMSRAMTISEDPPFTDGRLFTLAQRAQLKGTHPRRSGPRWGKTYVAGVSLPRKGTPSSHGLATLARITHPLTVTIAELDPLDSDEHVLIVDHAQFSGPEDYLSGKLREVLWTTWQCQRVVINGGKPANRYLRLRRRNRQREIVGEAISPGDIGRHMLDAIARRCVSVYADDGSPQSREFWAQTVRARKCDTGNGITNFYVEPRTGDDGYLTSGALAVVAAAEGAGAFRANAELAAA